MKHYITKIFTLLILCSISLIGFAQEELTFGVSIQSETGCEYGFYCLGCDGSLTITGFPATTYIKVRQEGGFPNCAFTPPSWDQTACALCDSWGNTGVDCNGTFTFPPGTVTTTNNFSVDFQSTGGFCPNDPWVYPPSNAPAGTGNLSQVLLSFQQECQADPTCPAGSNNSGGPEGIVEAFQANTTENLSFRFNSLTIPDQLLVSVNCETVVDSGPFSTYLDTDDFPYGICSVNDVTLGNGTPFYIEVPVEEGDNVTVQVIGDNCGVPGTRWGLRIGCEGGKTLSYYGDDSGDDAAILEEANLFTISPNPAKSDRELQFDLDRLDKGTYDIKVYDIIGNCLYRTENNGGLTYIPANTLEQGTYLIEVIGGGKKSTERVIIQ